jgi:hypothetical protein
MRPLLPCFVLAIGCSKPVPCPEPTGALLLNQKYLHGPALNEALVVTLPSGGHLLIDIGNDSRFPIVRNTLTGTTEWVLITHDHEDHAGALDKFELYWADKGEEPVFIDALGTWDLGDGVELELFLHDCALATPAGEVDLCAEVPGMAEDTNAMSSVGVLRYGEFAYLFAGDLTGGGKGTPDVESALVAHDLPLGTMDVLHLSHHGIQSSTNQAWVDHFLPGDGQPRNAVVSSSGAYLAAPHEDVLARVGPRLAGGSVWVTGDGSLAGDHETKRTLTADVVISVAEGGASYGICGEDFDSIDAE